MAQPRWSGVGVSVGSLRNSSPVRASASTGLRYRQRAVAAAAETASSSVAIHPIEKAMQMPEKRTDLLYLCARLGIFLPTAASVTPVSEETPRGDTARKLDGTRMIESCEIEIPPRATGAQTAESTRR